MKSPINTLFSIRTRKCDLRLIGLILSAASQPESVLILSLISNLHYQLLLLYISHKKGISSAGGLTKHLFTVY